MEIKVYWKERIYFGLMVFVSACSYGALGLGIYRNGIIQIAINFALLICVLIFLQIAKLYFIGHIRGAAVKISHEQFPDIYAVLKRQSELLGFRKIPNMYLMQSGGALNAFATRFARTNYVVLYSSVLEAAYQEGMHAVEFIIGHELGHIKRKHVYSCVNLLIFPAKLIPFLSSAYSRACEYTCDSIGYALSPQGAIPGMLILLAGNSLYKKVDVDALLTNAKSERGFLTGFAEILSSHPLATKRIEALQVQH